MTKSARVEVHSAILTTAAMMGTDLAPATCAAMALELASYPAQDILQALRRCAREVTGRLTLAAVLDRLPSGHPGVEAAWALCPRDEAQTVVWTDEVAQAYRVAMPLLREGDQVAARMAFRETYAAELARARSEHRPARWGVSLGHDVAGRVPVLLDAARVGRLTADRALALLPMNCAGAPAAERELRALGGGEPERALPAENVVAQQEIARLVAGVARRSPP